VAPIKGSFIVNIGDMLERWTNGLFRSTLHRVLSNGVERYSIPVFYEPNFDTIVECLPTCCSASNPPKYRPITSGGHLLEKYIQTHTGYDATAKPAA
jgi:isopenicillin N synthase-like dioxygenase